MGESSWACWMGVVRSAERGPGGVSVGVMQERPGEASGRGVVTKRVPGQVKCQSAQGRCQAPRHIATYSCVADAVRAPWRGRGRGEATACESRGTVEGERRVEVGNRKEEGGMGGRERERRRKGEEWGGKGWTERGNGKGRQRGDLNRHFHALKSAIAA